jgi:hypothetical protein
LKPVLHPPPHHYHQHPLPKFIIFYLPYPESLP